MTKHKRLDLTILSIIISVLVGSGIVFIIEQGEFTVGLLEGLIALLLIEVVSIASGMHEINLIVHHTPVKVNLTHHLLENF